MEHNINDLSPYVRILRRWWWLLLACTVVAGASSYIGTRQMARIYQATTTVMVGQTMQMANPSGTDIYISQQLAQTYAQMATRKPVLEAAARSLGLEYTPSAGSITTRQVNGTQLLEISVRDVDPVRACAVANAIAQQLELQSSGLSREEGQRQAFITDQLADLEQNIENARSEIDAEQAKLDAANNARAIQQHQANISALQQKLASYQSSYASLLLTVQGGTNYVSVVEPATVPTRPVSPNVPQTVAVSAGLGLLLGALGAAAMEYINDTIQDGEEAQRVMGLPLLASAWRMPGNGIADRLIAVVNPRSPFAEPFRILRASVQYASVDAPLRSLLVTSPGPSEGKSTVLANLGVVFAETGQRVIIVDSDLRRPVQHLIFGIENERGLSDLMREHETQVEPYLQQGPVPNLRLLLAGPTPPNPTGILASQRLLDVLLTLQGLADIVLLDSPPALVAADASILGARVDGVLMVADTGSTRRAMAKQAVEELRRTRANLIGLVLNRVKPRHSSYYYYSHYYGDHSAGRTPRQGRASAQRRGRGSYIQPKA